MGRGGGRKENLEICSRKFEIPREHFMPRWAQLRTNQKDLIKADEMKKR